MSRIAKLALEDGTVYSGQSFGDRIKAGELSPLSAPAWVEGLSEDDFPEVVAIQRGKSDRQGLMWTRKWYQWGHVDYNHFLIVENVVENIGAAQAEGVYVSIKNRLTSGASHAWLSGLGRVTREGFGTVDRRPADDYVRSTLASNYLNGGLPLGREKPAGLPDGKALADQGCHLR